MPEAFLGHKNIKSELGAFNPQTYSNQGFLNLSEPERMMIRIILFGHFLLCLGRRPLQTPNKNAVFGYLAVLRSSGFFFAENFLSGHPG